jgi:hypothetical protein
VGERSKIARRRFPSVLLARAWNVPGVGRVRLVHPTDQHLSAIDAEWPPGRRPTDWHRAWRWKKITSGKVEVFAVLGPAEQLLGIWCSAKHKPIRLPDGLFYRPDYLEVAPGQRGQAMGVFLFLLIATRALEVGARGIVFGTWDILRVFYRGLGGVEGKPRGWTIETNLIPFVFETHTLEGLREALERMEAHGESTTDI